MKQQYEETIKEVNRIISDYLKYIELNDLMSLEQCRSQLKGHRAILEQLYCDWCSLYRQNKRKLIQDKEMAYKEYRKNGLAVKDSESFSKLDTIPQLEVCDDNMFKRDKIRGLIKETEEIIIQISILLKQKNNEQRFG